VFIYSIVKHNVWITQHLVEKQAYLYYMFRPIHVAIILLLGRGLHFTNNGYHILLLLLLLFQNSGIKN
jgi:hypothetical protein